MMLITLNSTLAAFNFHDSTIEVIEKLKKQKILQYFKPNDTEYEKLICEINSHRFSYMVSITEPLEKIKTITESFMKKYNMTFTNFRIEINEFERFMASMKFLLAYSSQYNTYLTTILLTKDVSYSTDDNIGIQNRVKLASDIIFNPLTLIGMAIVHSLKPIFVNFPEIKPEVVSEVSTLFKDFIEDIVTCISENFSEVTFKKITKMIE